VEREVRIARREPDEELFDQEPVVENAMHLEERAEPRFHPDSYGYRPKRSALDAVGKCRQRCWKYDRAIDLDVEKFFDTVPWDLVVKAVEAVCDTRWVLLYVKRWLAAPLQWPDGNLVERDRGTPQGSAVSPILANLSCTLRSTSGWPESSRAVPSSATPTTASSTAGPSGRPKTCLPTAEADAVPMMLVPLGF